MADILILSNAPAQRKELGDILKRNSHDHEMVSNLCDFDKQASGKLPLIFIIDLNNLNSVAIADICELLSHKYYEAPVLFISAETELDQLVGIAVQEIGFIEKPFNEQKIQRAINSMIDLHRLKIENTELKAHFVLEAPLMGNSALIESLRAKVTSAANVDHHLLIKGVIGTEKTALANIIHRQSKRKDQPFVTFNCSLHNDESTQLFGSLIDEKQDVIIGLLEKAGHGTLVLEEFHNLSQDTQRRMVDYVKSGLICRIGDKGGFKIDVRIIATSSKDLSKYNLLPELVKLLSKVTIEVPVLAERREDIPALCEYFLKRASEKLSLPNKTLRHCAQAALQAFDWPCNLKQLENVMETLLLLAEKEDKSDITSDILPPEVFINSPATISPMVNYDMLSKNLKEARNIFEGQYIKSQMERFGGNISYTAAFINMERTALHRKLLGLGLRSSSARQEIKAGQSRKKNVN
jgi:two-component system nitrogen regulation response regulator NtrX